MVSPFAITTATNAVILGEKRQGDVTFTVSNNSGRPIRGRARLVPLQGAAAEWLVLEGEAERAFAFPGTQQFTVAVTAPPTAPAGRYLLRLDAVGVDNPDEEFSEGPTVALELRSPEPQPKVFPWWIVLVGLGLLAAGVLLGLLLSNGDEAGAPTPTPTRPTRPVPTLRFTPPILRPAALPGNSTPPDDAVATQWVVEAGRCFIASPCFTTPPDFIASPLVSRRDVGKMPRRAFIFLTL